MPVTYTLAVKENRNYYSPTGAEPVSIPLKGGGELEFGLVKFPFIDQEERALVMKVTALNSRGELETHPPFFIRQRVEFYDPAWNKEDLNEPLTSDQSREIDRVLGLLNPQEDTDFVQAPLFSPAQKAVLEALSVTIPK